MESGTQLGPYEIVEPLGKGGMGEVYRARDSSLRRDVAIKLLPEELATDPERLGRLKREARSLAALKHPHIATVHGFQERDGTRFIVMELVEGETLAEKLADGPLPIDDALEVAVQIARALEAAHERRIVHRDLKPGNVKVNPSGEVKVLDFGLAKPLQTGIEEADTDAPTATVETTRTGAVMGTAPYMSPEQTRGEEVDRRADVWAFGCVLYEMLTGETAFGADTPSDTLATVLTGEPDWEALPSETPPTVRRMLRRCLRKDLDRRLQHIGDARLEIEEAGAEPEEIGLAATRAGIEPAARGWRVLLPWGIAATLALALAIALALGGFRSGEPEDARAHHLAFEVGIDEPLTPPAFVEFPSLLLSPDGSRLLVSSLKRIQMGWEERLHLRSLDGLETRTLATGELTPENPFFSPDGRWIGFFTDRSLEKVAVAGGTPVTIWEDVERARGGSWGPDGTIVLAARAGTEGLVRVSETGGEPETITTPDPEHGINSHRWPQFLPGGDAVLFTAGDTEEDFANARIMVVSLESGEVHTVHRGGFFGRYVPSGHLLFVSDDTLFAAPFDPRPDRLELTGAPIPVLAGLVSDPSSAGAHYSVSDNGTLVYLTKRKVAFRNTVHWARRGAGISPPIGRPDTHLTPALSPDGTRLAVSVGEVGETDIWIRDLSNETMSRLTFDGAFNAYPVWSPDGHWIAYVAFDDGYRLKVNRADGSSEARVVMKGAPMDWSPDGRALAVFPPLRIVRFPEGFPGDGTPEPVEAETVVVAEFNGNHPRFSPDGRWIAYESDESGRFEIYVRPYPGGDGKWQVSTNGGRFATWSGDGEELYYLSGDRIMAVDYATSGASFSSGRPEVVVELPVPPTESVPRPWYGRIDVAPDDRRFVVLQSDEADRLREEFQPMIVLNWFEELERKVPTAR